MGVMVCIPCKYPATEIPPVAINALLPLFLENAHSVAMIKCFMDIVKTSVQYLNPVQISVLDAD